MPKPKVDKFVDEDAIKSFVCPRCGGRNTLNIVGGYYEKGSNTSLYQCFGYYRHDECNYTVGVKNSDPDIVWASPNGDWAVILMDRPRVYEARVMMTDGWNSWYAEINDRRDIYWDDLAEYRVPKTVRDQAAKILYGEYDRNSKRLGRKKPIRYFVEAHRVPFPTFKPFADYDKADKYAKEVYEAVKGNDGAFVQIGRFSDLYFDEDEIPPNYTYTIAREYNDRDPPKTKARKGLLSKSPRSKRGF